MHRESDGDSRLDFLCLESEVKMREVRGQRERSTNSWDAEVCRSERLKVMGTYRLTLLLVSGFLLDSSHGDWHPGYSLYTHPPISLCKNALIGLRKNNIPCISNSIS